MCARHYQEEQIALLRKTRDIYYFSWVDMLYFDKNTTLKLVCHHMTNFNKYVDGKCKIKDKTKRLRTIRNYHVQILPPKKKNHLNMKNVTLIIFEFVFLIASLNTFTNRSKEMVLDLFHHCARDIVSYIYY